MHLLTTCTKMEKVINERRHIHAQEFESKSSWQASLQVSRDLRRSASWALRTARRPQWVRTQIRDGTSIHQSPEEHQLEGLHTYTPSPSFCVRQCHQVCSRQCRVAVRNCMTASLDPCIWAVWKQTNKQTNKAQLWYLGRAAQGNPREGKTGAS